MDVGQSFNCPTFVKIYEISRFYNGKTAENVIKILWVILFLKSVKSKITVAKGERMFYNLSNNLSAMLKYF